MIGNETVYIKTWNTKRLTGPSVYLIINRELISGSTPVRGNIFRNKFITVF